MRTAKVKIKDKVYLTCFSTRVAVRCEERAGSIDTELSKISDGSLSEIFWLLSELLQAGAKYAAENGIEQDTPPTYDELLDSVGIDDYSTIFTAIKDTVSNGTEREIETKPSKNVEASQSN